MGRPLEGRNALVTGAGTRVGRAIALRLGALGADVAVHHHTSGKGALEVVGALKVDGNRAVALRADLTADPQRLFAEAAGALGGVSILVNSAAAFGAGFSPDHLWQLNARAPLLLTEAFASQGKEGDVINILDVAGVGNHWREHVAYCMSKAAAAELTRCMALKLAPRIRVNAVAPGTVLPPDSMPTSELERIRARIPQGRVGDPQDVAQAVEMLLLGPSFMTGQILAVDGGRSLA